MNKTNLIVITMVVILSGCSNPNDEPSQNKLVEAQPQIDQEDTTLDPVKIDPSENTTPVSNSDIGLKTDRTSQPFIQDNNRKAETLKAETMLLIKTLHTAFNTNIEEQQRISQKLQQATSRADDDAVMQMSIDMFTSQRSQLQSLPLTSDRVMSIRDKIIKALDTKIEVNRKSLLIRNPQPQDEQKLIKAMQESNRLSVEANNDLNQLVQEQDITF